MQARWTRLVRYLRSCVETEAAGNLVAYENQTQWTVLPLKQENLICGTSDTIELSDAVTSQFAKLPGNRVLYYGWPVAVLEDTSGQLRVVPVFVTELDRPKPGITDVCAVEEPFLNPGILVGEVLDAGTAGELVSLVAAGLPLGDEQAVVELISLTAQIVDARCSEIDRRELESELPGTVGVHNVAVLVRGESPIATRALIEELTDLEERTDWRGTAAAYVIGIKPAAPSDLVRLEACSPVALNDSQERVVEEMRRCGLTVVTGPPGTGKSQVVTAAVANAWLDGESVLVTSTNNAAVDVATGRATEIASSLLIRTGNKTFRDSLPTRVGAAITEAATSYSLDEGEARRELSLAARDRKQVLTAVADKQELNQRLVELATEAEQAARRIWDRPSAPAGLSANELREVSGRALRARLFRRRRRRRVLSLAQGGESATLEDVCEWANAESTFQDTIVELGKVVNRLGDEQGAINKVADDWVNASLSAVKVCAARRLHQNRQAVSGIDTARGGGGGISRLISAALVGARGWACTALAAKYNFALVPRMFDLVIVDEACQCSLAAVLPLAYRAKRIAVIGDPNQLRPIVGLEENKLNRLAATSGLSREDLIETGRDYGTGSAFTAFARLVGEQSVHLLNEHYRCHPHVARWFNETFYGGDLQVLTDVAALPEGNRGLVWIDVEGAAERGPTRSVLNLLEAEAVVDCLTPLLDENVSLAVVTPFAAQATLIERLAADRFGREHLGSSDFTVGTAHRLQGNERDVILFSPVVAPGIPARSAQWVERERNLLNVAASRARRTLIVLGHPKPEDRGVPTLASLRRAALEGREPTTAAWRLDSEAEGRLLTALHQAGYAPLVKPIEEGYVLDFALLSGDLRIDIEVDGDQHQDVRGAQRRRDLARDRLLRSLGWRVQRCAAWQCLREPHEVVVEIQELIAREAAVP
jgi:hypothetical protein